MTLHTPTHIASHRRKVFKNCVRTVYGGAESDEEYCRLRRHIEEHFSTLPALAHEYTSRRTHILVAVDKVRRNRSCDVPEDGERING